MIVQISMGWMGSDDEQQAEGSCSNTQLAFNPTQNTINNNPGHVAPINVLDPEKQLDTIATELLRTYIPAALIANKEKLKYVFANVNPKPANLCSWLQSVKWQYFSTQTGSISALCFWNPSTIGSCSRTGLPSPHSATVNFIESLTTSLAVASHRWAGDEWHFEDASYEEVYCLLGHWHRDSRRGPTTTRRLASGVLTLESYW